LKFLIHCGIKDLTKPIIKKVEKVKDPKHWQAGVTSVRVTVSSRAFLWVLMLDDGEIVEEGREVTKS
jgi:hypothetical protein